MNSTVLLAVIFPANLPYFSAFLKSVKEQADDRFDVLIGNDGVDGDLPLEGLNNVSVVQVTGSPLQTRLSLLQEGARRGYTKFIFADTDDELGKNRVQIVSGLLDRAHCVCNDVDLIDADGRMLAGQYWKNRLGDEQSIEYSFLWDKNIIGFGNTGLTVAAYETMITFNAADVPAPDWLFFSTLLRKHSALFTSTCTTRYRQHTDNLIGIKRISPERLRAIIRAKILHYEALGNNGIDAQRYLDDINRLQYQILQPEGMASALDALKTLNINYFWWEETNYLK